MLLERVGAYVEAYYARAQSVLAEETVALQPLLRDLTSDGFARRLTYESRVEWDPSSGEPASVTRQLVRVNGRVPRERDEPKCMDPKPLSPEPLIGLLPSRQADYVFTFAGMTTVRGMPAAMLDYVRRVRGAPTMEWEEDCVHVDLPGSTKTRVWLDPASGAVLRLDEHLTGQVDVPVPRARQREWQVSYLTIERADTSIRYAPVMFENPSERLLLPTTVETLTVVRNSGSPRMRITQTFRNYRRFVTDSRIVPPSEVDFGNPPPQP